MPTRNVVLTDHQEKIIETLVDSGRYQNASEVLRDGLRLVESRDAMEKTRLAALREAAREGIADLDAGRYREFSTPEELEQYMLESTRDILEAQP